MSGGANLSVFMALCEIAEIAGDGMIAGYRTNLCPD